MAKQKETVETLITQIESALEKLESTETDIETSTDLYAEALKLSQKLTKRLTTIEGKVKTIHATHS